MIKKVRTIIPLDLLIVLIWAIFTFVVAITPMFDNTIIRIILGLPAVLFIPGYVLVAVLYPKRDELENIERMTLSLGLSIVIIPLLGLLLNFTFGLGIFPMLITLYIYTVILTSGAAYRRNILPENERFSISFNHQRNINSNNRNKIDVLSIIMTFTIIILILVAYFAITTPKLGERFTEFYVLNSSDRTDNYLTNLKINNSYNYMIGITNHEYVQTNYTLKTTFDNYTLTTDNLILDHDETLENNINFVPNKEGTNMKLEFLLFKDDNLTEPYRELYLWMNVTR